MAQEWTSEQSKAIHLRGKDLLLSAAAGSGKTAVLVERILSIVTDSVPPVDIDRLLVVTFTKAAAAEMRERLRKSLEDKLRSDPGNENLQKQCVLLHHAQISTIHSFCSYVIRNYYHCIGLDPGYRMADEGEMKLLKGEVLKSMLEEEYKKGDSGFLAFSDAFASGRTDEKLEEIILRTCDFALSMPDPVRTLDNAAAEYRRAAEEGAEGSRWIGVLLEEAKSRTADLLARAEQNLGSAARSGPAKYIPVLEADAAMLRTFLSCSTYQEWYEAGLQNDFGKLPGGKLPPECTEAQKERVKSARDDIKADFQKLRKQFFSSSPKRLTEDINSCRGYAEELVRLAKCFMEALQIKKQEINVLDFSDLEHYTLQILLERTEDGWKRTAACEELSRGFYEILTDEYQDTNDVQELILEAVSGHECGVHNRFMVGDVKQSIYGFRQARPEIFLKKYHDFAQEGETEQRIDLNKNFRSRKNVLDTVNAVFSGIMIPGVGGLAYGEADALYYGNTYPETDDTQRYDTELLLMDRKDAGFDEDGSARARMEAEARMTAQRIRSLVDHGRIYDKSCGGERKIEYGDCVILLRSFRTWGEVYSRVMDEEGIPAFATSGTGYFSATEVALVLNYLEICGNMRQDIPFAAVLRSPIGSCRDSDLAKIRCAGRELALCDAAELYSREGEDEELRKKLGAFFRMLRKNRERSTYMPVHELISLILEETGYRSFAAAMPGGEQRAANLDMLVVKAVEFEKGSFHGLYRFIRYIRQMKQYEVDFGQTGIFGENANVVRLITIHKSKGLEFPVVFVGGLGGGFNKMDQKEGILFHSKLGIGMYNVDLGYRTRRSPAPREAILQKKKIDNLSEEMRILYVAMTRAQQKLILTGVCDVAHAVKRADQLRPRSGSCLSYSAVAQAGCYLDWILPVFAGSTSFDAPGQAYVGNEWKPGKMQLPLSVRINSLSELDEEQFRRDERALSSREALRKKIREIESESAAECGEEGPAAGFGEEESSAAGSGREEDPAAELRRFLSAAAGGMPPVRESSFPAVVSPTGLKKLLGEEETDEVYSFETEEEPEPVPYPPEPGSDGAYPPKPGNDGEYLPEDIYLPRFMRRAEEAAALTPAERGTLYHTIFESLRLDRLPGEDSLIPEIREQIGELVRSEKITPEEEKYLDPADFAAFFRTETGKRMRKAAERGSLWREQPFLLEVSLKELADTAGTLFAKALRAEDAEEHVSEEEEAGRCKISLPEAAEEEKILLQGIIDACFEEDGELVIVDYKTDHVPGGDLSILAKRHGSQLQLYAFALERLTGLPVKERILYSVRMRDCIAV